MSGVLPAVEFMLCCGFGLFCFQLSHFAGLALFMLVVIVGGRQAESADVAAVAVHAYIILPAMFCACCIAEHSSSTSAVR